MHDIRMGLFYLIQENERVRVATHLFSQLASFFVTNISWRGADQFSNGMFLHVFAHIKANHTVCRTEEFDSQLFGQLCLPDASRSNKEEATDWTVGRSKSYPITTDSLSNFFNSLILADYMSLQISRQVDQLGLFFFFQIANWNIGLLFDDVFDGLFANDWRILISDLLPLHFFVLSDLVTEVGSFFEIFITRCLGFEIFSFN